MHLRPQLPLHVPWHRLRCCSPPATPCTHAPACACMCLGTACAAAHLRVHVLLAPPAPPLTCICMCPGYRPSSLAAAPLPGSWAYSAGMPDTTVSSMSPCALLGLQGQGSGATRHAPMSPCALLGLQGQGSGATRHAPGCSTLLAFLRRSMRAFISSECSAASCSLSRFGRCSCCSSQANPPGMRERMQPCNFFPRPCAWPRTESAQVSMHRTPGVARRTVCTGTCTRAHAQRLRGCVHGLAHRGMQVSAFFVPPSAPAPLLQ